ncbi:hypothetical protein AVEN_196454-1 [Araneus ventricosus]|uniref:Uncharacterized protein n=1 Tax=Araneus ventricosus TaxID=182803 RepID=A0A4Y2AWT4_ARAVE|nr:hypothetical protein AVEN_196454-1 [Araneus ventricosus]
MEEELNCPFGPHLCILFFLFHLSKKCNHLVCILNRVTPLLPWHSGTLNDSRCNSSSTETGVIAAITGHRPTPPEGGTYYHRWEVTRPLPLLHPQEKREPTFKSDSFSSTNSWYSRGNYFACGDTTKRTRKTIHRVFIRVL